MRARARSWIRCFSKRKPASLYERGCGNGRSKQKQTIISAPYQIKVFTKEGRPVTNFPQHFNTTVFAQFPNSRIDKKTVCFASLQEEDEDGQWTCSPKEGSSFSDSRSSRLKVVRSQSDHLTTFATLLGGFDNEDCVLDWISVASLVMIGTSLACSFLTVLLYFHNRRFQAFIGGFSPEQKLSIVLKKGDQAEK